MNFLRRAEDDKPRAAPAPEDSPSGVRRRRPSVLFTENAEGNDEYIPSQQLDPSGGPNKPKLLSVIVMICGVALLLAFFRGNLSTLQRMEETSMQLQQHATQEFMGGALGGGQFVSQEDRQKLKGKVLANARLPTPDSSAEEYSLSFKDSQPGELDNIATPTWKEMYRDIEEKQEQSLLAEAAADGHDIRFRTPEAHQHSQLGLQQVVSGPISPEAEELVRSSAARVFDLFDMVYVLSVKRVKTKQDRALEVLKWMGLPEGKSTLWMAYEKQDWGTPEFAERVARELNRTVGQLVGNSVSPGAYGPRMSATSTVEHSISLSHASIYADILKQGYKSALILEDDFCISPYFFDEELNSLRETLTKNTWDALFLGDCLRRGERRVSWGSHVTHRGNYIVHEDVWTNPDYHEHYTHNCYHGYAVSQRAARTLLDRLFPLEWPIDVAASIILINKFRDTTLAFHHNLINQEPARGFLSQNTEYSGLLWELCAPLKHNRRTMKFGGCVNTNLTRHFEVQQIHHIQQRKVILGLCKQYWGERGFKALKND